jgi:tripeptide aminopeptidase
VTRAGDEERARLNQTFAALCAIPSPFGQEAACAAHVAGELRALGLEVEQDDAGQTTEAQCGNLLARLPGDSTRSLLLCAHLDTVVPQAPIEPQVVDGGWVNAHEGILGADNKAAVAVILEVARRCVSRPGPVGLELLFTVSEENALVGAKAFDAGGLRSDFGYVFDHASPIGEIVQASPTYYRIEADFQGVAAHAGIRPEQGRSAISAAARGVAAMPIGRVDEQTTVNVGSIAGGSASTNVVPARCRVEAEARSLEQDTVEAMVAEIVDHLHDGANAAECDVDVTVEQKFRGYRTRASAPAIAAAQQALAACGYEPRLISTGGGSDANALEAAGFSCVNLANGTERNHEPTERVSVAALEGMLDVTFALLDAAAQC